MRGDVTRFLIKLVSFGALLLVLAAGINYAVGKKIRKEEDLYYRWTYEELFSGKESANLVIFGSSRAKHGINPKYLERDGIRTFNFSLNGSGPAFLRKWYAQLFRKYYPAPRIAILEVNGFIFDSAMLWRKFEHDSIFLTFDAFADAILDGGNSPPLLLLNRFPIFRERGNLGAMFFSEESIVAMSRYYKGFVPLESARTIPVKPSPKPSVSRERLLDFEALLGELEKDRVKVVLVQTPEHRPAVPSAEIAWTLSHIRRISREKGIPYLDYNGERKSGINDRNDLYWDPVHLNEKGSAEFSIRLNRDLAEILKG
jgi:hypothetical protein